MTIPVETQYNTYDSKFLVNIELFKTWRYYLENCQHKILVLMDYNNLRHFINIKNLNLGEFVRLKSYQAIIFRSIIVKAKVMEQLMPSCNILSGTLR